MYEKQTAVLNCPCKEFPPMADPAPIITAYQEARRRAGRSSSTQPGLLQRFFTKTPPAPERFVPVLIAVGDDSALEGFKWLENETPEEHRQRLLAQPIEDGRALLARMAAQNKECAEEDGWDWPSQEVLGPMEGGE